MNMNHPRQFNTPLHAPLPLMAVMKQFFTELRTLNTEQQQHTVNILYSFSLSQQVGVTPACVCVCSAYLVEGAGHTPVCV